MDFWQDVSGKPLSRASPLPLGVEGFEHFVFNTAEMQALAACDANTPLYQSGSHPLSTNRMIVCAAAS